MAETKLAVLAYFARAEATAVLDAVAGTKLPVHVGTYGIDRAFAAAAGELPNAVYAPMFTIQPGRFWEGRRLTDDEAARVPADRWSGALPPLEALLREPARARLVWGTELGKRFRDALRRTPQPSWQFDEIVSQVATDRAWRDVIRGALDGLALGRPRLGDTPQRGIIWVARNAFPVASAPIDAELGHFWTSVQRATNRLAGEEYPDFSGDPRASAREFDSGRRALLAGGPIRRTLGRRYVAGLTPGIELRKGLGGNVDAVSQAALRKWRRDYVAQRAADGVRGFAYFDFRARNGPEAPAVVREIARALA
jgi:hypothetical protein